jgi:hypothetical protein
LSATIWQRIPPADRGCCPGTDRRKRKWWT